MMLASQAAACMRSQKLDESHEIARQAADLSRKLKEAPWPKPRR